MDEDTDIGTSVFSDISVIDKDTTGANIEVDCINLPEFENACEIFNIETLNSAQNSYQGAIVLNRKLNYADQQEYEFLLKASVCGTFPGLSGTGPFPLSELLAEIKMAILAK